MNGVILTTTTDIEVAWLFTYLRNVSQRTKPPVQTWHQDIELAEAVTRATRGRSRTNTDPPELDLQLLSLLRNQYVRRDKYCY